jgi:hypothetical protein
MHETISSAQSCLPNVSQGIVVVYRDIFLIFGFFVSEIVIWFWFDRRKHFWAVDVGGGIRGERICAHVFS